MNEMMTCPACRRGVRIVGGRIVWHLPLFAIPGRKSCPMSNKEPKS